MTTRTWYILVCRECSPDLDMPMPFATPKERGEWASDHTRGTGHNNWLVLDQDERSQEELDQIREDLVIKGEALLDDGASIYVQWK